MGIEYGDGRVACGEVLIRFADDELLEGRVAELDLNAPDFELEVADHATNNERAIIPFPSVKRMTLDRRSADAPVELERMQKVALRFRDGEVVKGLMGSPPRRGRYGVAVELMSPDGGEIELLGIPYSSLKAVFYLKAWDSRPTETLEVTGRWAGHRVDTPLVDLLADIGRLADLRDRREISDGEFQRRRRVILDMI